MGPHKPQLTDAELRVVRDQEFMKSLKVGIAAISPAHEDDEYSTGEFIDDETEKKFRERQHIKNLSKEMRRRRKLAEKDSKRHGGDIILWTFKEMKEGKTFMDKKEEKAKEVAEENGAKEEKKTKKEKVEKKAKKEKSTKKAKKEKKTKSKKEKHSRGPRISDGKITLIEKTNPKREGTRAYKRYELYKKHKDIASYLEAGGKRSSLRYDEKHNYIKLSNLVHGKKEKAEKKEKKIKK